MDICEHFLKMFSYNDKARYYITILLMSEFKLKVFKLKMSRFLEKEIKQEVHGSFFRRNNCFDECVIYGNKLGYYTKFRKPTIM